jgi:hypothetical protein
MAFAFWVNKGYDEGGLSIKQGYRYCVGVQTWKSDGAAKLAQDTSCVRQILFFGYCLPAWFEALHTAVLATERVA